MIAWVERHRTTVAYIILGLGVSLALWQNRLDAEARTAQAKAAVAAQARTLRVACEDRNQRDRRIAYGLARVVANLDADADDVGPDHRRPRTPRLRQALPDQVELHRRPKVEHTLG